MKSQNWVIGSQNVNTEDRTDLQANQAWNPLEILKAGILNGMFKKDSEQLKIISDEICNFLTSAGKALDPTDSTQMSEVYNDIKAELADVTTKTFSFKGYVGQTAPSSSTYTLNIGDMWINSANMPTTIPVSASDISVWNGTTWVSATNSYTPATFDTFSDMENNEGYYWFGGEWKVISTDLSLDYFSLNTTTGKWEIKNNVNLSGSPTTTTQATTDNSTKIATTAYVSSKVSSLSETAPGSIIPFGGTSLPAGYLACDGSAVSRTTYADLFSVIGTTWGAGDGSTTFNVPNFTDRKVPLGAASSFGSLYNGGAPNITGTAKRFTMRQNCVSGSGATQMSDLGQPFSSWACYDKSVNFATEGQINFNAHNSNSIYGETTNTIITSGYNCMYVIKY